MNSSISVSNIGPTIREARKEKGLTLKTLAAMSNLSVAFISQVERGKTRPSLVSLLQICESLEIQMADVLNNVRKFELYRKAEEPEYIDMGTGSKYIKLSNPFPAQKLDPFLSIVPPHYESASPKEESHEGEAFCYILSGKVDITYADQNFELKEGDSMHYSLSSTVKVFNRTDNEAKILWVSSVLLL